MLLLVEQVIFYRHQFKEALAVTMVNWKNREQYDKLVATRNREKRIAADLKAASQIKIFIKAHVITGGTYAYGGAQLSKVQLQL